MKLDFAASVCEIIDSLHSLTMRRLVRTEKSLDLLSTSYQPRTRPLFVCPSCRTRLSSPSQRFALSTTAVRRAESDSKVPFTEKIRRRIWGTESPPGQEDPYGDLSALDQTKRKRQNAVEKEEVVKQRSAVVEPDTSGYVPATTWDGLEQVGSLGGWEEEAWDEGERFRG